MTIPTIESRLRRRILVMSPDAGFAQAACGALPEDWSCVQETDLDALGGFGEILQFRFVAVDLDAAEDWDPAEAVRTIRAEFMLNVPVLCFGTDADARDEARMAGADRFFERAEVGAQVRRFCAQFGW